LSAQGKLQGTLDSLYLCVDWTGFSAYRGYQSI
jgi:hypothetical protein